MADASGLRELVVDYGDRLHAAAVGALIADVQAAAPVASGVLRDSVTETDRQFDGARYSSTIAAPVEYASWQDEGTGVYGPSGTPIRPIRAKALAWEGSATQAGFRRPGGSTGTGMVFAAEVAGSPATLFWSNVVTEAGWRDALDGAI